MGTKVKNTRKVFNFVVEIDGVNQFEFQKVKLPKPETAATEHGNGNSIVTTPGLVSWGEGTFTKLKGLPFTDRWAWDWMLAAQNSTTGAGGLHDEYARTVVVKEMHPNGLVAVNRWLMEDVWVSAVDQPEFDRTSSDNHLWCLPVISPTSHSIPEGSVNFLVKLISALLKMFQQT